MESNKKAKCITLEGCTGSPDAFETSLHIYYNEDRDLYSLLSKGWENTELKGKVWFNMSMKIKPEYKQNNNNMGSFKIEINCIGGHGVDREVKERYKVNFWKDGLMTPDALAALFVKQLEVFGTSVVDAKIVHWPGEVGQVSDDLKTGIRTGNF